MLGNLILALSNLYGLVGAVAHFQRGYNWLGGAIVCSVASAAVHHLFETNRHHMPGIGIKLPDWIQDTLTWIAFGFTLFMTIQTLMIFPANRTDLFWFFAAYGMGAAIPEIFGGYLTPELDRALYIPLHTAFHFAVYQVINTVALTTTGNENALQLILGLAGTG